ncbi:MAG: CerR family C-terminal domain-containing protein [bacterium]
MAKGKEIRPTSERLINAAGELFAEKGFKETTVREICEKAGANLAAVNYYFRDKENLYQEVLSSVVSKMADKSFLDIMEDAETSYRHKIYLFVKTFLSRRFDPDAPHWHFELIARQMVEAPESVKSKGSENIRTHYRILYDMLFEFFGHKASSSLVHKCILSIMGQYLVYIMMYHPHSPMPEDLKVEMTPQEIEERARHVADFSIGALEKIKQELPEKPEGPK